MIYCFPLHNVCLEASIAGLNFFGNFLTEFDQLASDNTCPQSVLIFVTSDVIENIHFWPIKHLAAFVFMHDNTTKILLTDGAFILQRSSIECGFSSALSVIPGYPT
jgi:hypothetical protein